MSTASHSHEAGGHPHAHHFESAAHEYDATKFGTWTFLLTEMLMFGGLFVGYILFHEKYPEMFHAGSTFLNWKLGSLNTVVLLASSLSMALSIHYAQHNNKKMTLFNLYFTLACAGIFMLVKYFEYAHKIHLGLLPGAIFDPHLPAPRGDSRNQGRGRAGARLHEGLPQPGSVLLVLLLHDRAARVARHHRMGLIVWLIIRTHKGEFSDKYWTPLECVGLFWHLVDLIWIYLFPLLYLIG